MQIFHKLRVVLFAMIPFAVIASVSCQSAGPKEKKGRIIGGVIGLAVGLAGGKDNRAAGAAIGGLIGTLLGSAIGRSMDKRDISNRKKALETSKDKQSIAWTNPNSGNRYRITPTKTYRNAKNTNCREYETVAFIHGREKVFNGKACRDSTGKWIDVKAKG